jgi:hypothetical protein
MASYLDRKLEDDKSSNSDILNKYCHHEIGLEGKMGEGQIISQSAQKRSINNTFSSYSRN